MIGKKAFRLQLEKLLEKLPNYDFRKTDPSGIVEEFINSKPNAAKLDIEIAALFISMISWGNRKAIRSTARKLVFDEMRLEPERYIRSKEFEGNGNRVFSNCVYRTLNFAAFQQVCENVRLGINGFNSIEEAMEGKTSIEVLSTLCDWLKPARIGVPGKSVCKRMCMYMRWMTRKSKPDFGVWQSRKESDLFAIMDVHVNRLTSPIRKCKTPTWTGCCELTEIFKSWDPIDPLKYDIALMMYADEREQGIGNR
jgi:uncharacterized protein (TIGR02757 family)